MSEYRIIIGDSLAELRKIGEASVNCCVTSPPYWNLRNYKVAGQIGLEQTPEEYVARLVEVFREVRRVLRPDGTCWVVLGDSYSSSGGSGKQGASGQVCSRKACQIGGPREKQCSQKPPPDLKPKDLIGIPWRVAFALQADGWYLRCDIIWSKPNPMTESVKDRPTKAHEYVFLLSKSERYYYDGDAISEPLATDPKENYPARARITGRGEQPSNGAAPGAPQRSRSGGYPPKQAQVGKRTYTGFNARWDAAEQNGTAPQRRNKRSVWTVATEPFPEAHFAVYPTKLIEPCILAGSPTGGVVLDPFMGTGTTGLVALAHGRSFLGIELNQQYAEMARRRFIGEAPLFHEELLCFT